jgi:hypothetical protein
MYSSIRTFAQCLVLFISCSAGGQQRIFVMTLFSDKSFCSKIFSLLAVRCICPIFSNFLLLGSREKIFYYKKKLKERLKKLKVMGAFHEHTRICAFHHTDPALRSAGMTPFDHVRICVARRCSCIDRHTDPCP